MLCYYHVRLRDVDFSKTYKIFDKMKTLDEFVTVMLFLTLVGWLVDLV